MEKECTLKTEACDFVIYGCKAQVLPSELAKHMKASLTKHVVLFTEYTSKKGKERDSLLTREKEKEKEIETLKNALKDKEKQLESLKEASKGKEKRIDQRIGELSLEIEKTKAKNEKLKKENKEKTKKISVFLEKAKEFTIRLQLLDDVKKENRELKKKNKGLENENTQKTKEIEKTKKEKSSFREKLESSESSNSQKTEEIEELKKAKEERMESRKLTGKVKKEIEEFKESKHPRGARDVPPSDEPSKPQATIAEKKVTPKQTLSPFCFAAGLLPFAQLMSVYEQYKRKRAAHMAANPSEADKQMWV